MSGRIHTNVEGVGQPAEGADHVELRATTVSGDVVLTQRDHTTTTHREE